MYLDLAQSQLLMQELVQHRVASTEHVRVAVFPTALALSEVIKASSGTSIGVGAQNIAWVPKGAYTGAISAHMYKEAGCAYALIGHSERRYIFGETDDAVRKKIEAAFDAGLVPVVCIGETKEDRETGKQQLRIREQVGKIFHHLDIPAGGSMLLAYEPVWAVGTQQPCDAAEAALMHTFIKKEIKEYIAQDIPVLYGGSVNEENVVSYVTLAPIDGVLVGHASIHGDSFARMVTLANNT